MKKVFVDTNILVDLIGNRQPFSKYAIEIFTKAENKELQLYTSSHSMATKQYILNKLIDEKSLREILYNLLEFIQVVSIDENIIRKALKSSHKDFEDAIQISCAYSVQEIDCIVTRDIKDFRKSEIPVFSPDELLNQF